MTEDETLWPMDDELQTLSMLGSTISDRYKLQRLLGEGGMGTVYLASDELLGRQVAVKITKSGALGRQNEARFFREARSLARLNHPNIVTLFDYGWDGAQAHLVMEYATGTSLRSLMSGGADSTAAGHRGLTIGQALDIGMSVAKALCYAHRHGVIHRDIKPENIMVGDEVKLMDFGIAKVTQDPSITMAAGIMGTPAYMAPEQALGEGVDERTDLYSFGIVLYEMLTGRPPFSATDEMSVMAQQIQVAPAPPSLRNSSIPKRLDRLILSMLAKSRDKRPTLAEDVLLELELARKELTSDGEITVASRRSSAGEDDARVRALRSIPMFACFPREDLSEFAEHLRLRAYRKGQTVFNKDDFGSTLHIVKSGSIKISMPSDRGDEVVLARLGPGDFFGELALLDEEPRSATATAIDATKTLALEREDFLSFLRMHPDMAIRILETVAQRIRNLNTQLERIIFSNPIARVAGALSKLVDTFGVETPEGWEISHDVTTAELARLSGVPVKSVTSLLRDLKSAGVLSTRNRRFVVHRVDELRSAASKGIVQASR